jgi:transcriptional regulator with XRE-family HTH domain
VSLGCCAKLDPDSAQFSFGLGLRLPGRTYAKPWTLAQQKTTIAGRDWFAHASGAEPVARQKNPVDAHVGLRIRAARLAAGWSQERLGNALSVTFQQVQKYEKGVNRVGAGRLSDVAKILGVSMPYFFENLEGGDKAPKVNEGLKAITEALSTSDGIRIARALARIPEPDVRRRIADLLEAMVERERRANVA